MAEKTVIRICELNTGLQMEKLIEEIEKLADNVQITIGCTDLCVDCIREPFILINNQKISAPTEEKLLQLVAESISKKIKINN